jgi:hypothetical protein
MKNLLEVMILTTVQEYSAVVEGTLFPTTQVVTEKQDSALIKPLQGKNSPHSNEFDNQWPRKERCITLLLICC